VATPAARHVVGNFIVPEDIKSARDVIDCRIGVPQSRTPEVQRLANARWRPSRWAQWAPPSSRGLAVIIESVIAGERRPKMLADLAIGPNATQGSRTWWSYLNAWLPLSSHGKVRVAGNRNRLNRTKRAMFSWPC